MTSIDVGPIRPPSEAQSLLIRVTRNCPWNRCRFCQTYKGKKFSLRPVDEVKRDIEMVTEIFEEVKSHAWKTGHGGTVTKEVIYDIHRLYGPDHAQVAMWLANGGNTAFLQDADSLIRDPRECIDIIRFLKETFPSITRITTYARGRTIARKRTVGELKELKQAGLTRIHMGLETGYDPLLEYMHKGVTAREYITAGQKLKEAGIELCLYVILGLGGKKMSREHARATAEVLNAINPDHIRFRTLAITNRMPLYHDWQQGTFERLSDEEIVKEERELISRLTGTSLVVSDHILNLLEEVQGKLPQDKPKMLGIIDKYLEMPTKLKVNFTLGRRALVYRYLDDLQKIDLFHTVERAVRQLQSEGILEQTIFRLHEQYIS